MNRILDACALIAYLKAEQGGQVVDAYLRDPGTHCYAHVVNLCEVYYAMIRSDGLAVARAAIHDLKTDGVSFRRDMGRAFWLDVGELKAKGNISIADCFCLALARKLSGAVVTSDHHEFDPLVPLGICAIEFIR